MMFRVLITFILSFSFTFLPFPSSQLNAGGVGFEFPKPNHESSVILDGLKKGSVWVEVDSENPSFLQYFTSEPQLNSLITKANQSWNLFYASLNAATIDPATEPEDPKETKKNDKTKIEMILENIFVELSHSGALVVTIYIGVLLLAVLSIILIKSLYFKSHQNKNSGDMLNFVENLLKNNQDFNHFKVKFDLQSHTLPYKILETMFNYKGESKERVQLEVEKVILGKENEISQRYLNFIGRQSKSAPYIGLLGTIFKLLAFTVGHQELGSIGASSVFFTLLPTAMGLMIAYLSSESYGIFFDKSQKNAIQTELFRKEAIMRLEKYLCSSWNLE